MAATTAPKPTRLATDMTGSTEAFAPASMVLASVGRRAEVDRERGDDGRRQRGDHGPDAADRGRARSAPHCGSARKPASIRGRMTKDITRLTGSPPPAAGPRANTDGALAHARHDRSRPGRTRAPPWRARAGFHPAARSAALAGAPRRSPRRRAAPGASSRFSHHMPKPSMMSEAMMPRPGAAKGVVPKNGMGMAFWIDGRAGQGRHGEGRGAKHDGGGHQAARDVRRSGTVPAPWGPAQRRRRTG